MAIAPDDNIPAVKDRAIPQYLVLGTLDRTVKREPIEAYVEHLHEAGQTAELVIVEGAGHAFFDWKPDQRTRTPSPSTEFPTQPTCSVSSTKFSINSLPMKSRTIFSVASALLLGSASRELGLPVPVPESLAFRG